MQTPKDAQQPEAGRKPRPSRLRRRAVIAAGVLLLLGIIGYAVFASLRPCWSTYRAPDLTKGVCLADNAIFGFGSDDADSVLETLTYGWEHGDRREFVPLEAARAAALTGDAAQTCTWLKRALEGGVPDRSDLEGPDFSKVMEAPCFTALLESQRQARRALEEGLSHSTPEAEWIDPDALAALLKRTKETKTSALVIVRDGAIVHQSYAEGGDARTELMSATKAIAGLSIGLLVDEGRIASVDTPLSTFFPEWREGEKSKATLRHVLTHSTGLAGWRNVMDFIWRRDFVRHAIEEDLERPPGTEAVYSNKATNLIPGVVQHLTGKPMDAYLDERLFGPLGIRDWDWLHDPSGNPHGMSGLRIHPVELAKIGVMLAQGGRWGERQVLSEAWVDQALRQGAPTSRTWGFLFVVSPRKNHRMLDEAGMEKLRAAGLEQAVLDGLEPLLYRPMESRDFAVEVMRLGGLDLYRTLSERDLLPPVESADDDVGATASGTGGIHLAVFPDAGLVAVRTTQSDGSGDLSYEFPDFANRVRDLVPELAVTPAL